MRRTSHSRSTLPNRPLNFSRTVACLFLLIAFTSLPTHGTTITTLSLSTSRQWDLLANKSYRNFFLRQYFIDLLNASHSSLVQSMISHHYLNVQLEQSSFIRQLNTTLHLSASRFQFKADDDVLFRISPCHSYRRRPFTRRIAPSIRPRGKFTRPCPGRTQSNRSLPLNLFITLMKSSVMISPYPYAFDSSNRSLPLNCSPSTRTCSTMPFESFIFLTFTRI